MITVFIKEYSNYELEKEVRSCNLENYGLKASYFEVNKGLIKNIKINRIKNIGSSSSLNKLIKDIDLDPSNQIIYTLENRMLWLRNNEFLLVDIRTKFPFYLIQDSEEIRYFVK